MDRKRVSSSRIRSVGYDRSALMLEVEFNDGAVHQYRSVPESVYEGMMRAPSIVSYFDDRVRDEYGSSRVR